MDSISLRDDQVVPIDQVAPGVVGLSIVFVNVFGIQGEVGWTLVDAGLYSSSGRIMRWAREHFAGPPQAIVLTHGHFDHVGALDELVKEWEVPVYAHVDELPYVTGERAYPPPDPTVGGGMMARMSKLYPTRPVSLGGHVRVLPADGSIPGLDAWQAIHTPGHTAGHVSLYRPADGTLVVGDAFCTTTAESMFKAIAQPPELHGPPAYFTTDWDAARDSVARLAALSPSFLAPGHGRPMAGAETMHALQELAARFDEIARPSSGRYVERPVSG